MAGDRPEKLKKSELVKAKREPAAGVPELDLNLPSTTKPKIFQYRTEAYYPDIIENILRVGSVNIFSGPTRAGKSTLLAQMVAKLLKGEPIFGVECRAPSYIVYVALDHSWSVYQRTFDKVGVGVGDLAHYAIRDDPQPGIAQELAAKIDKHGTYAGMEFLMQKAFPGRAAPPPDTLVIIDPIHPMTGKDISDYVKLQITLTGIGQYCGHYQITVLGSAHTAKIQADPKKQYARAVDRAAGSTALGGYSETMFSLVVPQEIAPPNRNGEYGKVFHWHWSSRHQADRVLYLMFDPEGGGLFVSTEAEDDEATQQERATAAVLDVMKEGEPIARGVLLELTGLTPSTLTRYLNTLQGLGMIGQKKKGVWVKFEGKAGN